MEKAVVHAVLVREVLGNDVASLLLNVVCGGIVCELAKDYWCLS